MSQQFILVVDDDPVFRSAMAQTVRTAGFRVSEADDGGAALRLLEQAPPDLLITDMLMPDCDGVELITAARRLHPELRVMAVSGFVELGGLDLLKLARTLGAQATLLKPFSAQALLTAVDEVLAAA